MQTINVGTGTHWVSDFKKYGTQIDTYLKKTVERVLNEYVLFLKNKKNNSVVFDLFNSELVCDCDFEQQSDPTILNADATECQGLCDRSCDKLCSKGCPKTVLREVLDKLKILTTFEQTKQKIDAFTKKRNPKNKNNSKPHDLKEILLEDVVIGKTKDDPFITVGEMFNNRYICTKALSSGASGCLILAKDMTGDVHVPNDSSAKRSTKNRTVVIKISRCTQSSIDLLQGEYNRITKLTEYKRSTYDLRDDHDVSFPTILNTFSFKSCSFGSGLTHLALVLELYGSDLYKYVPRKVSENANSDRSIKQRLSMKEIQQVFRQLAKTLKVVHACNIIHKDVKRDNVLIRKSNFDNTKDDCDVILIDYSMSIDTDGSSSLFTTLCGTVNCMAPEEFFGPGYHRESDIFSLGLLIVELVKGRTLFGSCKNHTGVGCMVNAYEKIFNLEDNDCVDSIVDESDVTSSDAHDSTSIDTVPSRYNKDVVKECHIAQIKKMRSSSHTIYGLRYKVSDYDAYLDEYKNDYFVSNIDDPDLVDLLNNCLEFLPKDRATLDEILRHPFITKVIY
ncbi:dual specificity tyrosine-phosphorylation-regulated kinase 4 [Yasminevirus sp. GU-2018]|uniref:Dual specificity tyrosine-phosphorylation-regulated kinase 4 n=1 Tax=Yasminevirus sp. GU-2018 TaxID=2420051 RepID=A0A5K0UAQ4_9VIRU|nr:dual specificity tyrosine-phosphorylation-regulated kinase 4 [Yasminevirus sp. GU-2018]